MAAKIGNVTSTRYRQLVREGRELVEQQTSCQFQLGDKALEIEPMRNRGGGHAAPDEELFGVREALTMYADDIGVPYSTLRNYRWTSAHWPRKYRQAGVSHYVHRILARADDPFKLIKHPPSNKRTGETRWTIDEANRAVGWQVNHPVSKQEKVEKIHDLAREETVAAAVATDFLRRPDVAFRAMRDDTARHMVNRAQTEQARQAGQTARERTPAIERFERTAGFIDLIGACAQFVSAAGRALPALRGHRFTADERTTVHKNLGRVRATADWIESAVDTGDITIDEDLERLLRGEGE